MTTQVRTPTGAPKHGRAEVRFVSPQRRDEILCDAAAQQTPVVLTCRGESFWQTYKSRLLGADQQQRVLIEALVNSATNEPIELAAGVELGVTFRRGHKKCMFAGVVQGGVQARDPSGGSLRAVSLRWPEQLHEMQRRVYLRVPPPDGEAVDVRYWRGGAQTRSGDEAASSCVGRLCDLSAGGMGITVANATDIPLGDAVGCAFTPRAGEEAFVLDATLRHIGCDDAGRHTLGLQFIGLETSLLGQETLARLAKVVTTYQRAESRRREARWRRPRSAR